MALCAVVDGNQSQPARPASDAQQHAEDAPDTPAPPDPAATQPIAAQLTEPEPPPDIPDSKSPAPEIPAPLTTPAPSPAVDKPPADEPTAPTSPIPNYGTPSHLAARRPEAHDNTPQPASLPFTPRHLRRGPASDDGSDRSRMQVVKDLFTPRNTAIFVPAVIVALIGLVIVSWAVDNARHSDQVQRNVSVAGHAVGGATEESLAASVASAAEDLGDRPVNVAIDGEETESVRAADLGLVMDEEAAVEAAMDVGRSGSILGRPFEWFGSMFSDREIKPSYTVSETQLAGELQLVYDSSVEGTDTVVQARNPNVALVNDEFTVEPGQSGTGLDLDQAADKLLAAADGADDPFDDLELSVETSELAPEVSEDDVEELADELNDLTASGITLDGGDATGAEAELTAAQLRSWITPIIDSEDAVDLDHLSPEEVENLEPMDWVVRYDETEAAVTEAFSDLSAEPVNAEPVFTGSGVEVTESEAGVTCCGENIGERVWEALENGETTVDVDVEVVEPEYTTEVVESWGIKQPIGGSRGWRSGQEVGGPRPGYTTWDVQTGAERAHNIGTMASQVNGAWIAPGDTWSINDHVGARHCPPYQKAGAIIDGEHVDDDCGGGTSQFATTTLNAAYFAGLDVDGTAHSEYFDRYPAGREATMGAPGTPLNVTITNNTEYGVVIQSARHGDEVTVTIWSTPSITVQDLGNQESMNGKCRVVTNTRERTFPDGSKATDTFRAEYRPGEGETC